MQTDILQNIICTADPEAIARDWEASERTKHYSGEYHLDPPLLKKRVESLKRQISAFQEKFSQLQPAKGNIEWVAIANTDCDEYTYASFYEKRDFEILLEKAVTVQLPDKLEEDAPQKYYREIAWIWDSNRHVLHGHYNTSGSRRANVPWEEVAGVEVFPLNIDRHGKGAFTSSALYGITYNDRYIRKLPEWETDPEIEAITQKMDKEYKYIRPSRKEERMIWLQMSKDTAKSVLAQVAEFRQLYKELNEG